MRRARGGQRGESDGIVGDKKEALTERWHGLEQKAERQDGEGKTT